MRSNCCLTRLDLRRRKWLFMPFVRMITPVPVILNRRADPLWVFIFGIAAVLLSSAHSRCYEPTWGLPGRSLRDHVDNSAAASELDMREPGERVTSSDYNTSAHQAQPAALRRDRAR